MLDDKEVNIKQYNDLIADFISSHSMPTVLFFERIDDRSDLSGFEGDLRLIDRFWVNAIRFSMKED